VGAEEDNDDDAGPQIAVGSRAVSMRSGGAASIAASSIVRFVISDSEDDSLVESMISESEGDVQGNNNFDNNDNFSPPMQVPEGAPPAAPNINDGPRRSTRENKPIDRFVPGVLLSMMAFSDGSDGDGIPTVAELLESPLANHITLAANDCGYSGMAEEFMDEELLLNYVHLLILKARSSVSREDNSTIEAQITAIGACMRELISIEETIEYLWSNIIG
jgi:hypothetical protein